MKIIGKYLSKQSTDLELGNNKYAIIIVIILFLCHVGRYYMVMLLNR